MGAAMLTAVPSGTAGATLTIGGSSTTVASAGPAPGKVTAVVPLPPLPSPSLASLPCPLPLLSSPSSPARSLGSSLGSCSLALGPRPLFPLAVRVFAPPPRPGSSRARRAVARRAPPSPPSSALTLPRAVRLDQGRTSTGAPLAQGGPPSWATSSPIRSDSQRSVAQRSVARISALCRSAPCRLRALTCEPAEDFSALTLCPPWQTY